MDKPESADNHIGKNTIQVSGIQIEWDPEKGRCTFENLPVAMMWVDTTLAGLMSGVQAMVGTERYLLALQGEGRKSVEADWRVISTFPDFRRGFEAIANIAAVAGWGDWKLISLDENLKECIFRVTDSWEGRYQKALGVSWGSGMLAGKMAGYCSKLFGTNCWADQTAFIAKGDLFDEFIVRPSTRSLETEIENFLASDEATKADMTVALRKLEKEVAERMRAEATLRESEKRYSTIFNTVHDALLIHDLEGWVLDVNQATLDLFRIRPDEVRQMNVSRDFSDPNYPVDELPGIWKRVLEGEKIASELNVRRPVDGACFQAEVWLQPINLGNRDLILANLRDISDRKRAERELRESEKRYRLLVDNTEFPVVVTSILEGHVLFINECASSYFEVTPSEAIGQYTGDYWVFAEDRKRFIAELSANGRVSGYECELKSKGGKKRSVLVSANVLEYEGQPAAFLVYNDITDRKRAEAERIDLERRLLHAQKLESLGILAGGIAHDFNNLLMAILGNLDIALMRLPQVSPARPRVEQAMQATHRATDLTRQMLAYSGRGHFVVVRINLSELVRENAGLFRSAIARSVTMNLNLEAEDCIIEGDLGQVQQVIMNLITNASEAIGEKAGTISLTTGIQDCDDVYLNKSLLSEKPPAGNFAYIEVSDDGCGMDEETLQRIFDPFYTTKFTGRGLGMSAVLGIVRGHKGTIMVESQTGIGTTVRILFPACKAENIGISGVSDGKTRGSEVSLPPGMILVVDDEDSVRNLCIEYLIFLGFQALSAEDGEAALRLFKKHSSDISCVLLDLTMPRMDGVTTFREMKAIQPGVKVILCSGYDEQDATQRFTTEGLVGFLQKPYLLNDLKDKLEIALGGRVIHDI